MRKLIFLFLTFSLFACDKKESDDVIYLRNTLGEITMEVKLENDRWAKEEDLTITLTLKNDPKANPELEKYMRNVGGQTLPTELSIDWGDGTVNNNTVHTYAKNGSYKIIIKGRGINWFSDEMIGHRVITYLDIEKCPTLQGIIAGAGSRRPVDGRYSFHNYPYLEYLDFVGNLFVKQVDLSQNKHLKGLAIYGYAEIEGIIDYGIDLSSLPDLKFVLMCTSNEKDFQRIAKNKNVTFLKFFYNCPYVVDFAMMPQLEELVILESKFESLDLSKNLKLKGVYLYHGHNRLMPDLCHFTDEIMNNIYSKLPPKSGTLTTDIPFGDKSIAEKQGWAVETVVE